MPPRLVIAAVFAAASVKIVGARADAPLANPTCADEKHNAGSLHGGGTMTPCDPQAASSRERADEAWWTGPIVAASAETLPQGRVLVEPYFFDVHTSGQNQLTNLNYVLYGLTEGFSLGAIFSEGEIRQAHDRPSSSVQAGDVVLFGQFRLTHFTPENPIPTVSFVFEETLPVGRYDNLGNHESNGMGTGAYTTSLGIYIQDYVWLPNGRILRPRLDVLEAFPGDVPLKNASVYGTSPGFSGNARPGRSFVADAALEYSVTQHWVLALDCVYRRSAATAITGLHADIFEEAVSYSAVIGPSAGFVFAPAVEFNFSENLGILVGARVARATAIASRSTTPVLAINWTH